jgi:predicted house-cleaning noncanonical NTP pyrophosphatase (MazG superfamily)
LSHDKVSLPNIGSIQEIILSGSITNQKRGIPLSITLTNPDGIVQNFAASLSTGGSYKSIFTINDNSLPGKYFIHLFYDGKSLGSLSFSVISEIIPDSIKNNARQWSSDNISDSEFIDGIEDLIEKEIISDTPFERNTFEREIPDWIKNNAKWWVDDLISDEDFIKSINYLIKKGIIRI